MAKEEKKPIAESSAHSKPSRIFYKAGGGKLTERKPSQKPQQSKK